MARPYVDFIGYNELGERSRIKYSNGTETTYSRHAATRRLADIHTDGPGATAIQRVHYDYNAVGNITGVHNLIPDPMSGAVFGGQVDQTYQYDDLDQIIHADGVYRETSKFERRYSLTVSYDAIHNIVDKEQLDVRSDWGGGAPTTVLATSHSLQYQYQVDGSLRPHAAMRVGSRIFDFDSNGNQRGYVDASTGSVRQLEWNAEDRLTSATTDGNSVHFLYDADGERTHKYSSKSTTVYANEYWSVRNAERTTKHIFAGGQRIVSVVSDPLSGVHERWLHGDHLGSTHYVTDHTGSVREHHESLPFGEPWIDEWSSFDTSAFRFAGKERDEETGLHYFGARYLDPRQAQWLSVDPAFPSFVQSSADAPSVRQPARLALFTYSANSPLVLVDRDGRDYFSEQQVRQAATELFMMLPIVGSWTAMYQAADRGQTVPLLLTTGFFVIDCLSLGFAGTGTRAATRAAGVALAAVPLSEIRGRIVDFMIVAELEIREAIAAGMAGQQLQRFMDQSMDRLADNISRMVRSGETPPARNVTALAEEGNATSAVVGVHQNPRVVRNVDPLHPDVALSIERTGANQVSRTAPVNRHSEMQALSAHHRNGGGRVTHQSTRAVPIANANGRDLPPQVGPGAANHCPGCRAVYEAQGVPTNQTSPVTGR